MPRDESAFLPGTLDLLILKVLAVGPVHGWGISMRIRDISEDVLHVNQGSLYPAIHRLEQKGLVMSDWGRSTNNRRVKVYRLSGDGALQLNRERENWKGFVLAVERILETS